jgi:hypothetical protein
MKTVQLISLALVSLVAAVGFLPSSAAAAPVTIHSPYAAAVGVSVWIGSDAANNRPLVCFQPDFDLINRTAVYVSNDIRATGLADDLTVHGSDAADTILVLIAPTATPCGLMGVLNQNGYLLTASGGDGNDSVRGGVAPGTTLSGDDGNDIVTVSADFGTALGGNGDDSVGGALSGTHECLLGEEGNDCLWDLNITATLLSGGGGRDLSPLYVPLIGMPASVGCSADGSCDVEGFIPTCLP